MSESTEFFYNLATGAVEEGRQSRGQDLMGPYGTRAEAQAALATAAKRSKDWEQEDQDWDEYGSDSSGRA